MKKRLDVNGFIIIGEKEDLQKLWHIVTNGAIKCWDQLRHYSEEEPVDVLRRYYEDLAFMAHDLQVEMSKQLGEED